MSKMLRETWTKVDGRIVRGKAVVTLLGNDGQVKSVVADRVSVEWEKPEVVMLREGRLRTLKNAPNAAVALKLAELYDAEARVAAEGDVLLAEVLGPEEAPEFRCRRVSREVFSSCAF